MNHRRQPIVVAMGFSLVRLARTRCLGDVVRGGIEMYPSEICQVRKSCRHTCTKLKHVAPSLS